jgi:putative sulfotransferase
MVLSRGYEVPEIVYPFAAGGRYRRSQGLPWMLVAVVPRLSAEPDALYDELLAAAAELPARHLAEQYRALFEWLARRAGKRVWIERSGSSIDYLESLHAFFPRARFLHLHRDGREAALSMREHHAYRLAISLMVRHLEGGPARTPAELGALDPGATPTADDPIGRLLASRPDPVHFGRYWSRQVLRGFRALRLLDAAQYAEVSFEELVARPEQTLRRICAFFELDPEAKGWIPRAAALLRGAPPARFPELPPDEAARLAEACAPGMELLGR